MGEKVVFALKETYKLYKYIFNWYFLVDDDAYVFIQNLNRFTKTQDHKKPLYYGKIWNIGFQWHLNLFKFEFNYSMPYRYISGGPGVLFTNESMNRLITNFDNGNCAKYMDSYGDITVSRCADKVHVSIGSSLDKFKKPRFHAYNHRDLINESRDKDCCSLESISFHYINITDMYSIHANKTFLHDLLS